MLKKLAKWLFCAMLAYGYCRYFLPLEHSRLVLIWTLAFLSPWVAASKNNAVTATLFAWPTLILEMMFNGGAVDYIIDDTEMGALSFYLLSMVVYFLICVGVWTISGRTRLRTIVLIAGAAMIAIKIAGIGLSLYFKGQESAIFNHVAMVYYAFINLIYSVVLYAITQRNEGDRLHLLIERRHYPDNPVENRTDYMGLSEAPMRRRGDGG